MILEFKWWMSIVGNWIFDYLSKEEKKSFSILNEKWFHIDMTVETRKRHWICIKLLNENLSTWNQLGDPLVVIFCLFWKPNQSIDLSISLIFDYLHSIHLLEKKIVFAVENLNIGCNQTSKVKKIIMNCKSEQKQFILEKVWWEQNCTLILELIFATTNSISFERESDRQMFLWFWVMPSIGDLMWSHPSNEPAS